MKKRIKQFFNQPYFNILCFNHPFIGKIMCKLNLNHSIKLINIDPKPDGSIPVLTGRCVYCGKIFKSDEENE